MRIQLCSVASLSRAILPMVLSAAERQTSSNDRPASLDLMSTTDTPERPATAIEIAPDGYPWLPALAAAVRDLRGGFTRWRIWGMLAINDVRQRYRRSLLGQFWLTLSMGVT